jgi:hypothetical protein
MMTDARSICKTQKKGSWCKSIAFSRADKRSLLALKNIFRLTCCQSGTPARSMGDLRIMA